MKFFNLFLPTTGFLLGMVSLAVCYWVVTRCKEGEFIPIYYFLALSLIAVMGVSASRITHVLLDSPLFGSMLFQDLMIAWTSLFLFGAIWQSYEASICVVPKELQD